MGSSVWRTSPGGSARARSPHAVPEAVAPPELRLDAPWSAAPVTPSSVELDLVRLWMSAPHVARHWRQDWPHADWEREVVAQHASVHSRPWIIAKDGEAIAYVEIYRPAIDLVSEWFPVRDGDL